MVSILKDKYVKIILTTIFLLTLLFMGIYLWAINDVPYKRSLEFIKKNKQVIEAIGEIENLYLSFFGKYYVTSNGTAGYAEYKIKVNGDKSKGIVYIVLRQNEGKWKVVQCKLVYADDKVVNLGGEE